MKKGNQLLLIFFFFGMSILTAQETQDTKGNAEVFREPPPPGDVFLLNPGITYHLGNVMGEDYAAAGEGGQSFVKFNLDMIKSFGPMFLVGQVSDTIALGDRASANLLNVNVTPLFILPYNLITGFQLSATLPFYEGRLMETAAQIPPDYPAFKNYAQFGLTTGLQYTQPFDWGAVYGNFLLVTFLPFDSGDLTVSGDFEAGVKTNLGINVFVSPLFMFHDMGKAPDPVYTSLEAQISYAPQGFPLSGSLTFMFPGAQTDGFKRFGFNMTPNVHFAFMPGFDTWIKVDVMNIANKVEADVSMLPSMGVTYMIPLETPGNPGRSAAGGGPAPPPALFPRWHIGLAGGYSNNQLYTSTTGRPYTEFKNGHGFEIAVPIRYQVTSWFGLQTELQYIQKNYYWGRTGQYSAVETSTTNSFLDIPLMANFSLGGENLKAFINVGAYAGIWLDSHIKGTMPLTNDTKNPYYPTHYYDFDEQAEFDKQRDARFDGGLLAGLGFQYSLKVCSVFLEGRYYYGLTDLQQNYGYFMVPRMNSTFDVRMGVLFNKNFFQLFKKGE